ncbi:hypothetical protein [Mesorhizobium sp.]|uniref:hypothetical protein n=1 Tax=Mesorhizobium sp. TaxID=1871066 RepID=UPI0012084835|nr:hypothetical protein [Mesorhizobium sp.]TIM05516.1 MAG: hypothetical protein E5Y62_27390 [Mesorhizobium sp.]
MSQDVAARRKSVLEHFSAIKDTRQPCKVMYPLRINVDREVERIRAPAPHRIWFEDHSQREEIRFHAKLQFLLLARPAGSNT